MPVTDYLLYGCDGTVGGSSIKHGWITDVYILTIVAMAGTGKTALYAAIG